MIRPDSIGNESGRRSTARLRLDFCGHGCIRDPRLKAHYYFTCRSILNWEAKGGRWRISFATIRT